MEFVTHAALKRLVYHLMLLHAALSLEGGGADISGVMVAIAA